MLEVVLNGWQVIRSSLYQAREILILAWSPNITQLGTGSNQLTINGSTGIISAPTINATSLQEGGVEIDTKFAPSVSPTFSGALV